MASFHENEMAGVLEASYASMLFQVATGIGLAASTGLRAFLPVFVVGVLGRLDLVPLRENFEWLESAPALVIFGTAVVLEVLGDKIPGVDHFLDMAGTVIKPAAGALVVVAALAEFPPLYAAVIGLLVGGSVSGSVHVAKAGLRAIVTGATVGTANPAVSATEDSLSLGGALLAIFYPVIFLLATFTAALLLLYAWRRRRRQHAS